MEKKEAMKIFSDFFDLQDSVNMTIKMTVTERVLGIKSVKPETLGFAAVLKKMIRRKEYPFDCPVVAIKDIMSLVEFKNTKSTRIGLSLKQLGCRKYGQVRDSSGYPTRVWIVRDFDNFTSAKKRRVEKIFQERIDT